MSEPHWAVVLGASAGTGAAVSTALAQDPGLHVFGVHRGNHPGTAAQVEASVLNAGRRIHLRVGDAATPEGADAGVQELLALAGPRSVKFFVHSIANASVGYLVEGKSTLHPKQVRSTFDGMAHSFIWWAQAMFDADLLAPEARLLGLSNPLTDNLLGPTALIAASKAALEVYVQHLAKELGPHGHRVNLLKFGSVITKAARTTFGDDVLERHQALLRRAIPAGRTCEMEEVARLVSFLAGPHAGWFNGATIDFTGAEVQSLFDAMVYPDRTRS